MLYLPAAVAVLAARLATALPQSPPSGKAADKPEPFGFFVNNTIYQTTGNESITYPRYVELTDGTILATSSLAGHDPGFLPIFESKDGGASWAYVSNVTDQVNGWGFSVQPALAELTSAIGDYPAGTILAAANSWSRNATRIDLYASHDSARTWKFVSHIAEGGPPNTTNGATPIWEPYLLQYGDTFVAYYSDQRDPKHGQKLSHQESKDLKTWGPPVDDVALQPYQARPGMTVVAFVPPINKWILVHERPVGNSSSYGANYPVHYVLADTPLEFGKNEDIPILIDGVAPNASPYVDWSPEGGDYGTIVVSDADHKEVYTNRAGGDRDQWEAHATPAGATYSRALHILKDRPDHLLIFGGETYDSRNLGLHIPFSATVVDLYDVLDAPAGDDYPFDV